MRTLVMLTLILSVTLIGDWKAQADPVRPEYFPLIRGFSVDPNSGNLSSVRESSHRGRFRGNELPINQNYSGSRFIRSIGGITGDDWDPGYYKAMCSENGVLMRFQGRWYCAATEMRFIDDCEVRIADGNHFAGGEDWDPGHYKADCRREGVAVGISHSPSTGNPHAIVCCRVRRSRSG